MTSDVKRNAENIASNRSNLRKTLAWNWLVLNRKDIAEAIKAEAWKQLPGIRKKAELPDSLKGLK